METREWEQKWDGPSLNQSHIYTFAKSVTLSLSWHHTWFVLQVQNKGTSAIKVGRTNDCIACSSVSAAVWLATWLLLSQYTQVR